MRHVPVFAAVAFAIPMLALGKPAAAQAQPVYPYCFVAYDANTAPTGSYQCGYLSYAQCRTMASGLSGQCERNPELFVQQKPARESRKAPRR